MFLRFILILGWLVEMENHIITLELWNLEGWLCGKRKKINKLFWFFFLVYEKILVCLIANKYTETCLSLAQLTVSQVGNKAEEHKQRANGLTKRQTYLADIHKTWEEALRVEFWYSLKQIHM